MIKPFAIPLILLTAMLASGAIAQETQVPFGGLKHDSSKKIEVSADSLVVSQGNSSAEFKGNVLAGQGTLKIEADRLIVEYKADSEGTATGAIHSMTASGKFWRCCF